MMVRSFLGWILHAGHRRPKAMQGQAMIMLALMMPMLLGFAGLVIDVGILYVMKASLQNTVDAAALAGAQSLPATSAGPLACDYINLNPVTGMNGANCNDQATIGVTDSNTTITVTASRSVPTVLMGAVAQLLGQTIGATDVRATATVKIGSVGQNCVFPLFVQVQKAPRPDQRFLPVVFDVPDTAVIDEENTNQGAAAIKLAMTTYPCSTGSASINEPMDIKPGGETAYKNGWIDLKAIAVDSAKSNCTNPDLATYLTASGELKPEITFASCPRLKVIPVVQDGDYGGNNKTAVIKGFVPIFFSDICLSGGSGCTYSTPTGTIQVPNNRAYGYFLDVKFSSGTYTDHDPYGTSIVVMTN